MIIVADSIPGLKRWLAPLGLKASWRARKGNGPRCVRS